MISTHPPMTTDRAITNDLAARAVVFVCAVAAPKLAKAKKAP